MAKTTFTGTELIKTLKSVNQPIKLNVLVRLLVNNQITELTKQELRDAHKNIKNVLAMAVKWGFVKKCNGHYFAATHYKDISTELDWDSDEYFSEADSVSAVSDSSSSEEDDED
ncbi:GL25781 [Drosophila persimilis]|uniref:GL25781 n=1 Tax=Drosophila persimilis TaxID=7234 RepID=B4GJY6_DROPE|nr:GL25781 [Drosophila persimilis]